MRHRLSAAWRARVRDLTGQAAALALCPPLLAVAAAEPARSHASSQSSVSAVSSAGSASRALPASPAGRTSSGTAPANGPTTAPQAAVPAPSVRLELRPDDCVVLLGNTLAERQQFFNHFETLLMTRFPELRLRVRNLGWSGDTLTLQPRPLNFGDAATHLEKQKADVILAFFGLNESFDGEAGLARFEQDLDAYLRKHLGARYNGESAPRLALVSPIAHERLARLPRIDTETRNTLLARYTESMRAVAARQGVPFVDLFTPTRDLMAKGDSSAAPLTINGIHVTERGDRVVAALLMRELGFDTSGTAASPMRAPSGAAERRALAELRELIRDKNEQFFYRWRPLNAEYVVGRRVEPFGSVNFPKEMAALDRIVSERDREIWKRALPLKGVRFADDTAAAAPKAAPKGASGAAIRGGRP